MWVVKSGHKFLGDNGWTDLGQARKFSFIDALAISENYNCTCDIIYVPDLDEIKIRTHKEKLKYNEFHW